MLRPRPAFAGAGIHHACQDAGAGVRVAPAPVLGVPDANRTRPLRLPSRATAVARLLRRMRPDAIWTAAARGSPAILFERLPGIRGLVVDLIANAGRRSISLRGADAVLTRWPAVARRSRGRLGGRVPGSGA
jgi:hypothetical protein